MGKSTTEQIERSKDKNVLNKISLEELYEFLNEDDDGMSRRIQLLRKHYADALSDSKTAAFSRTDLLDRDMGKPKQQLDMTTKGQAINSKMNLEKLSPDEVLKLAELTDKATD